MPREAARRAFDLSAPQSALKTAQGFLDLARNSEPVRPTIINDEIGRDRRVAFAATTLAALKQVARSSGTRDGQRRRPRRLDRSPAPPVRAPRGRDPGRLLSAGADEHPQARRGAGARQPDDDADRPAPARRARRRRAAAPDPRDDRAPEAIRGRAGRLARDRGVGLGAADDDPRPRLGGLGRRRRPGADRGRPGRPSAAALEPGHLQRAGAADARLPARPAGCGRSTRSCRSPRSDERSRSA